MRHGPFPGRNDKGRGLRDERVKMEQMQHWLDAVCERLDLDPQVVAEHRDDLLALISAVAHGPSRPGAPMTAFVVGYVSGAGRWDTGEVIAELERMARQWEPDRQV
ncbi:DUF6457 domain-containing protein [Actinomyces israelii]